MDPGRFPIRFMLIPNGQLGLKGIVIIANDRKKNSS